MKGRLIFLAVVSVACAFPDKRPQQYAPPPPPQNAYAAPPQQAYQPAPQAPPRQTYVPAPQTNTYNYAPAPAQTAYAPKKVIAILSQDFKMDDYGYVYNYASEDYQQKEETGKIIPGSKKPGNYGDEEDDGSLQVQGSYSYTAPDGTPISLTYTADENGFQPQGAHLPTPPPLPQANIDRINEHNAAVQRVQQQRPYSAAQPAYEQPAASYQRPQYSQYF